MSDKPYSRTEWTQLDRQADHHGGRWLEVPWDRVRATVDVRDEALREALAFARSVRDISDPHPFDTADAMIAKIESALGGDTERRG